MSEVQMIKTLHRNGMPAAVVAAVMAMTAPFAIAQQPAPPGAAGQQQASPQQQEFMQLRAELQQLQQQLGEIQEQVLEDNPELQEQQEDLRNMIMETMKEQGATPDEDINKLKTLQAELQKEDMPEDKRQRLIQEFRETNMGLQQAQQQAMQEEELQQVQQSLNDAMLTAMVDANPETEKLISQVQQTRQKLMQMQQEIQRKMQGGGGGPR
ncbi:MAG: hypothetical protein WD750_00225 [Gammaproteobacteria bacterium]